MSRFYDSFRLRILKSRNGTPNTFVEGIGSEISNKYAFSKKIGISVKRIENFRITGDTLSCRIKGRYKIGANAFYNNQMIRKYLDPTGLVEGYGPNAFRNSSITHIETPEATYAEGYTEADSGALRNATKLIGITHKLGKVGIAMFQNCSSLPFLDVSTISGYGNPNTTASWTYGMLGMRNCTYNSFSSLVSFNNYQTFMNNTTNTIWDFPVLEEIGGTRYDPFYGNTAAIRYNFPVLIKANIGQGFQNNTKLEELNFPVLVEIYDDPSNDSEFIRARGIIKGSGVKRFIANEIENLNLYAGFSGAASLELIEMKKCKRFGRFVDGTDLTFFSDSKRGFTLRVHQDNMTVNNGSMNEVLKNAKTNFSAIVEFYDDNGNYVSTL